MAKKGFLDPALVFILKKLREENEKLPPEQRMGLEAYCKKYGILAPKHWEVILKREVSFSELQFSSDLTGEGSYEEEG